MSASKLIALTESDKATLVALRNYWAAQEEDDMVLMCDAALKGDRESYLWVAYELEVRPVRSLTAEF